MTEATTKPPQVDVQDPLPEPSWFFRRIITFLSIAAILFLVSTYGDRMGDIAEFAIVNGKDEEAVVALRALSRLCDWLLAGLFLVMTYYLVAPSAEHIVKVAKVARSLQAGVAWETVASATADGAETRKIVRRGHGGQSADPALTNAPKETGLPGNGEGTLPWRR